MKLSEVISNSDSIKFTDLKEHMTRFGIEWRTSGRLSRQGLKARLQAAYAQYGDMISVKDNLPADDEPVAYISGNQLSTSRKRLYSAHISTALDVLLVNHFGGITVGDLYTIQKRNELQEYTVNAIFVYADRLIGIEVTKQKKAGIQYCYIPKYEIDKVLSKGGTLEQNFIPTDECFSVEIDCNKVGIRYVGTLYGIAIEFSFSSIYVYLEYNIKTNILTLSESGRVSSKSGGTLDTYLSVMLLARAIGSTLKDSPLDSHKQGFELVKTLIVTTCLTVS